MATSVVQLAVRADDGDDEYKYLDTPEIAFIKAVREQVAETRQEIARVRALLGKPVLIDPKWQYAVSSFYVGSLPPAPEDFKDIEELWKWRVKNVHGLGPWAAKYYGQDISIVFEALVSFAYYMDQWVDEVEAGIKEVEAALEARKTQIQERRKAEAELIKTTAGCFIATAAYGTPAAAEIDVLREFRDDFLLHNPPGKAFVSIYYRVSPPVAEFISKHEVLRIAVRDGFVDPVVKVVEMTRGWWGE